MDYRQFMKLMDADATTSGKDSVNTLQEFVNEFPYFQSAHVLLAKTMHEQQHVRYEKQLKIAAAYAGDRKSLHDLIHPKSVKLLKDEPQKTESQFSQSNEIEIAEGESIFSLSEESNVLPPFEEETIDESTFIHEITITPPPTFYKEEVEIPEVESDDYDEPTGTDPHEIIKRRLIEILGLRDEKKEELSSDKIKEDVPSIEPTEAIDIVQAEPPALSVVSAVSEPSAVPVRKDLIEQLTDKSISAIDIIDKAEIEYALEASIIQSLEKLPVIEPPVKKHASEESAISQENKENSFFGWLKIKRVEGYGIVEEVHAYDSEPVDSEENQGQSDSLPETAEKRPEDVNQIIDRFIQTKPKIVPSKAEFYSPATQAKMSVTEHEDVVSETLAKIYREQGNLLKARSSYQKLSLLFPEKLAYFAALISEIDKEINNLNKQDL